ncbi:hypothetical protein [Ferroplasma sp.]|uniref:hypothetical protein n=1 Tax=Ferroplasma sp. TaxID=2591003 RepID=UPI00262EB724|nr:hypothetical protein [Ferroplasma sp.]
MDLKDAKILYPLDPGIYNKRVKFLSVNTSSGEIAEILSAINFYPCYIPLDQSLITLSITSSNILENIKTMLYMENQIAYANLHETKRKNDYVSYGTLVSKNIEKQIVDLYNYEAWLGLVLDRPQIINKKDNNYDNLVPISCNRYFHIKNTFQNGVFEADFSFSNILVEISENDYKNTSYFNLTYFGKITHLISIKCSVMQFYKGLQKSRIAIALKKEDYLKLKDVRLKILSVYTMYNIKKGEREFSPLNLVTGVYDLMYSLEEIALFLGDIKLLDGLTVQVEMDTSTIQKLKNSLYSDINSSMDINTSLPASKVIHDSNEIKISLIKPEIIIKLITAYVFTSNNSIKKVLESNDLYSAVINFYNRIVENKFDEDGNLIPSNIISYLKS